MQPAGRGLSSCGVQKKRGEKGLKMKEILRFSTLFPMLKRRINLVFLFEMVDVRYKAWYYYYIFTFTRLFCKTMQVLTL